MFQAEPNIRFAVGNIELPDIQDSKLVTCPLPLYQLLAHVFYVNYDSEM